MLRLIGVLFCMLALSLPLGAEPSLRPYSAEYTVQLNGLKVGELQRSLRRQGEQTYLLETRAYTTGLASWFKPDEVVEKSRWRFEQGEPVPLRYDYSYSGRRSDVLERQEFDWQQGVLRSLRDGKTTSIDLEPGLLDKQVFEIAMQQGLEQGAQTGSHRVALRGRITDYAYRVLAREQMVTRPFGEVETLKVQRGNTTMWLAPAHDYIVVRIRQRDGGNTANSYITQVSYH